MIQILLSKNTDVLRKYYNSQTYTNNKRWLPENSKHPVELSLWLDKQIMIYNKTDKLTIATHSKSLINRLGDYIENGLINHNDVRIYIIDPGNEYKLKLAEFKDNLSETKMKEREAKKLKSKKASSNLWLKSHGGKGYWN